MVYHSPTFGPLRKNILIETWPYPLEPGRLCIGSQGIALFSHISTKRPSWGWNLNWLLILGLLSIIWVIFCKNIISRSKLHLGSLNRPVFISKQTHDWSYWEHFISSDTSSSTLINLTLHADWLSSSYFKKSLNFMGSNCPSNNHQSSSLEKLDSEWIILCKSQRVFALL